MLPAAGLLAMPNGETLVWNNYRQEKWGLDQ